MDVRRGDVVLVDLGAPIGSVQGGIRPAVVMQNDIGNHCSSVTTVVPLTSRSGRVLPMQGIIQSNPKNGLSVNSMYMAEQTMPVDQLQIRTQLGRLSDEMLNKILYSIIYNLSSNPARRMEYVG